MRKSQMMTILLAFGAATLFGFCASAATLMVDNRIPQGNCLQFMLLAFVAGCVEGTLTEPAGDVPIALRVGSYNIRLQPGDIGTPNAWNERKADMVGLIRKLDLDVFGLQEVYPEQADYLTNSLPQYAMVGVHREDGKREGEASPVLYRKDRFESIKSGTFWLSETPDIPGSKSWGTA